MNRSGINTKSGKDWCNSAKKIADLFNKKLEKQVSKHFLHIVFSKIYGVLKVLTNYIYYILAFE